MNAVYRTQLKITFAMLFYCASLQEQLIATQRQIIELQKRIDDMTPKTASDKDVFWHIASGGVMSTEAANSDDVGVVRRFRNWNVEFAKKHIQPYVNPEVYGECLNQMTRGLPEHIARLETKASTHLGGSTDTLPS